MGESNRTETRVELRGVHLCCGGCVDAVATALERVPGVTFQYDMDNGTVDLTAPDDAAAQEALDAIAANGLHGETSSAHLAMKPEPNVPAGKVRRLTVSDIHNCCWPCYEAIKGAIESVEGVTGDTAQPGETTFEVIGNFSAADLVRALNRAGFHATVKE
jgi:periplasmic mercuric ion binding protein